MNVKRPVGSPLGHSLVSKRSVVIDGHRTSISLEDAFWDAFKQIAANKKVTLSKLVDEIEHRHRIRNLSSAIRLFVLDHYRSMAEHKSELAP